MRVGSLHLFWSLECAPTHWRQKKTARPVSRSRRFARTFNECSSHSPRGAAGHNPLRDREWPVNCGIPARYHHPRGTTVPCAWTARIEPQHRFPVSSPLSRGGAASQRRRFRETLQRSISSFRHREKPYGSSLRPLLLCLSANSTELRERNLLPRRTGLQARESTDSGGLSG